ANRSLEMVVAAVAALKAGCGYVPLDPMYPAERLLFMLENSGVRLLLAHDALTSLVSGYEGQTRSLDGLIDALGSSAAGSSAAGSSAAGSSAAESSAAGVSNDSGLAYIIYTSGSTGTPKGVVMGSRALDHLIDWQLRHTSV